MSDLAVIKATFCDFRIVKGRKQAQLIFEVPLEQAQEAITRLGMPQPSDPVWCAIALLDMAKTEEQPKCPRCSAVGVLAACKDPQCPGPLGLRSSPPKAEANAAKSEQGKERYRKMPEWEKAATRAVLLCKDAKFQNWAHGPALIGLSPEVRESHTADWLKDSLRIRSRKDIATEQRAYIAFVGIESEFRQATGQMAEVR